MEEYGMRLLDSIVGNLDSILLVFELDNRGYRSKDLLLRNLVLVVYAGEDGRLDEVSLVSMPGASQLELRFLLADLDIVHHLVELHLGDETSVEGLGVLSYLDLLDHTLELGNELIMDGFMDDDSGTDNACLTRSLQQSGFLYAVKSIRPTGLTGSLEQTKSTPSSRGLDVGSREDDIRRLFDSGRMSMSRQIVGIRRCRLTFPPSSRVTVFKLDFAAQEAMCFPTG